MLGLDPDPGRLWPRALEIAEREPKGGDHRSPSERAARAVAAHCRLVLEAVSECCVAVKPQLACFERLGAAGWGALAEVVADARDRGLVVIADGKRGDIDISARAYAQAFFGATESPFGRRQSLGVDALTVNPLLGRDSLTPLVDAARADGGGLFVLTRTSNPGAADVQDQLLEGGGTVSALLARIVDEIGRDGIGATGLADVGAVTGATAPDRLEALRTAMPHAILLLPGIGPQGATGEELAPAYTPGRAGGLVSASRAIVYAGTGSACAGAAAQAANTLRELVWGLYS